MSADGGNLVGATPGFREPAAGRLAQPVRRAAFGQSGRVAPFPKALAEMVAAVWLAGRGDQKRQMLARRGVDHRLEIGVHRDYEGLAGLFLVNAEYTPHAVGT